jgi:hypothetical protein
MLVPKKTDALNYYVFKNEVGSGLKTKKLKGGESF